MKLELYWEEDDGQLVPRCHSDDVNSDGINLVSCLLMDDGGIPYQETVQWIEEGVEKVEAISNDSNSSLDWSREAWGASLTPEVTKVYSLHDEEYFSEISTSEFKEILTMWRDFIKSTPDLNDRRCKES
ncbi:hypothetical protein [Aliikangiella maris]|uniref:Uncharacterized protein n=2 Tax=Aliikangiella maris TaxID=3162458 RepID=A0ABV2BYB6_9GAMM